MASFQDRAQTIYYRYGSYAKAATALDVDTTTFTAWAKGERTARDPSVKSRMNRMVGQYRHNVETMANITSTAETKAVYKKRRDIREQGREGTLTPEEVADHLELNPLMNEAEREETRRRYRLARETDNPEDWEQFREQHRRFGSP